MNGGEKIQIKWLLINLGYLYLYETQSKLKFKQICHFNLLAQGSLYSK